jgi:hypothetical protein
MVAVTILHLKLALQAQQRCLPHSGVAFAWLKIKVAARWVGGFLFSPSRLFLYFVSLLPCFRLCTAFNQSDSNNSAKLIMALKKLLSKTSSVTPLT